MNRDKSDDNKRAIEAATSREAKDKFLTQEQVHILRLTARILKCSVTESDDEYSIALMAVSEAIDSYKEEKGPFWNYAALVIRSRIIDEKRANKAGINEMSVAPDTFEKSDVDEDEAAEIAIRQEVQTKTAVYVDRGIRDELDALEQELKDYGVDLFDLPASAPKSAKTKEGCREVIAALFLPPPLVELLRKTKNLPIKELLLRCRVSRKLIDRHRKYLLASMVVKAGDYEKISEYIM